MDTPRMQYSFVLYLYVTTHQYYQVPTLECMDWHFFTNYIYLFLFFPTIFTFFTLLVSGGWMVYGVNCLPWGHLEKLPDALFYDSSSNMMGNDYFLRQPVEAITNFFYRSWGILLTEVVTCEHGSKIWRQKKVWVWIKRYRQWVWNDLFHFNRII